MYTIKLKRSTRTMTVKHVTRNMSLKHVGRRGPQGEPGDPGVAPVQSVNGRIGHVVGLAEQADLDSHTSNVSNPHSVTKAQVGLGNVDNTSDANKPISNPAQTALDGLDTRVDDIEGIIDVPTDDQTDLDDFLDIYSTHIPPNLTGVSGGATQGYRDPSPFTEIPNCLKGIELLVQQMGEKYAAIDLTAATALLSPFGFTVEKGFDSVSKKPYVLIYNEWTWPAPLTSNTRAWGVYLIDMSEPMRMIVEAPHPQTDGNSEYIALDVWRETAGCIYILSGNNRKAKAWFLTEIYTTATLGTFTLTFRGQTTAPIAFDATRTPVQTALEALPSIGVGKVVTAQGAVNSTNHCFIYLDYSLYDPLNPTDTITGTNIDMDQSLSVDHDADVAHNINSLFHKVAEKYGVRRTLQYQQHGFSDTSGSGTSLVVRGADVILSSGSSNTNSGLYALRDAMEAVGLNVLLKGTFDTQIIYTTGTPTGGTMTLTYNGQTTGAITYSTTLSVWASNVQTALSALSNIGANNVLVTPSNGDSGATGAAIVVTFAGQLVHLATAKMTITPSLTGGTSPTAVVFVADDSLLTANTNAQGDVAEANGSVFYHLEASNTVRTTTDLRNKLVSSITGINLPLLASANMPALAEAGHTPSQTPIAVGRAAVTGSRNYAANAGHTHAWSSTDTTAGNSYIATRNSGNTGNTWTSPTALKTNLALTKSDVGLSAVTNDAQLKIASNLSDVASASTSRTNLGLGSIALLSTISLTSNVTGILPVANGGTGAATAAAAKTSLGLGNVDNTSDASKPVSTATQTALDLKANDNAVVKLTGNQIVTGSLTFTDASLTAGTSTDVLGTALAVMRNGVQVGRIDNNSNGLRVQAQTGTLQLRGTGNTGISVDSSGSASFAGNLTLADAMNIIVDSTTGTKIGTATTQKLGFYNATPVTQQAATADLGTVLSNLGLRASGTAYSITTSGLLTLNGGVRLTPSSRTANVTLATGSLLNNFCNATTAPFTVTLPSSVSLAGQTYTIKKVDSTGNAVTVATTSSQTIDGSTTYLLSTQYKYVTVVSDGANWMIVGNN